MATMTLTNRIARARLYARDTSTSTPGLADADYTNLLNDASAFFRSLFPDDFITNATATWSQSGINSATYNLTTATNVRNVVAVQYLPHGKSYTDLTTAGVTLERVSMQQLMGQSWPSSANGMPTKVAVTRDSGSHTSLNLYFDTFPGGSGSLDPTLVVWYTPETTAMSAGSDTDGLDEAASLTTCIIAAIRACPLLGRDPAFKADLLGMLPQEIQEHMTTDARAKGPHQSNDDEVV